MNEPSPKRILIIEDDPIVGHIYRSRLEKEGYTVELATDGQSGFYALYNAAPDGLLLDLMLPKMNGIEVLKKIRAQADFRNLPVIVFTNAYVPTMVQEAYSSGASAVFDKATLTPRQITDALHTHLFPDVAPPPAAKMVPMPSAPAPASPAAAPPATPAPSPVAGALKLAPAARRESEPDSELPKAFFTRVPEYLASLRKLLQEVSKAQSDSARQGPLGDLYRQVHSLTSQAAAVGLQPVSRMASALEALLKELVDKPKSATPSTLRTVANAVDLLGSLCGRELRPDLVDNPPVRILVVDDDLLSRRAVTFALQKSFERPDTAETSEAALALAGQKTFDVIFLDVMMPGMSGFALCEKIRASGPNKTTPIIFVTGQTDFSARAQSTLSGGSDLIAKPFLFIEVTVKALTFALRGRLTKPRPA